MKTFALAVPLLAVIVVAASFATSSDSAAQVDPPTCVVCHEKVNPGIVAQWRMSKHSEGDLAAVGCAMCHGSAHQNSDDWDKATMPSPKVCGKCHEERVKQFSAGKHALADASAKAIPMVADQPWAVRSMGCMGCHDIGRKWDDGSVGRCDACHTRHLFSVKEAKSPEACETCHMGEDHSQYEMWRSSKHGVIHHTMPELGRAPVCQTCHMQDGDHAVMTGWGFLGLKLPVQDKKWSDDTITIVKALGPWGTDDEGMKTRVGAIKALKLARLDQETFDKAREKMIKACGQCHSKRFGEKHLIKADEIIKQTTHLMADAVRVVDRLYADGILPVTKDGPKKTDLLMFYDSPTEIEQELYRMFLFHRQKAFQGAIHTNPDYMHWYGWAPMKSSMLKIRTLDVAMREKAAERRKDALEKATDGAVK